MRSPRHGWCDFGSENAPRRARKFCSTALISVAHNLLSVCGGLIARRTKQQEWERVRCIGGTGSTDPESQSSPVAGPRCERVPNSDGCVFPADPKDQVVPGRGFVSSRSPRAGATRSGSPSSFCRTGCRRPATERGTESRVDDRSGRARCGESCPRSRTSCANPRTQNCSAQYGAELAGPARESRSANRRALEGLASREGRRCFARPAFRKARHLRGAAHRCHGPCRHFSPNDSRGTQ